MTKFLEQISQIVKTNKIKAYLIGGTVRDILLGKQDFDLDIAVEGNGLVLGKLLQKKFGGKLISHSEFGTGTLIFYNPAKAGQVMKIDFANCRKEIYPDFAKLPKVESCSLREDLKRRDFTINTLALDLQTGNLIDLFGGKRDIEDKKIRCLHLPGEPAKSFMDDPTRIFRALRFAGRLDFTIESNTAQLMKKAIKDGFIQKLTPKRIRNEIVLILQETKRENILKLMANYGVLEITGLNLPEPRVFENIDKNLSRFPPDFGRADFRIWFVYLLGVIDLNAPPIRRACQCVEFTKKEQKKIKRVRRILDSISQLKTACPSEVYKLLYGSEDEELVFIMSVVPPEREKIIKYMQEYSKVKTEVTGHELSKMGIAKGPLYKKILSRILYAKLDGKVKNKEEEIGFLKNLKLDNIE